MIHILRVSAALLCVGCATVASPPPSSEAQAQPEAQSATPSSETGGGTYVLTQAASEIDAPEISRSAGEAGGIVVFWPRIVVPTTDGLRLTRGELDAETRALGLAVQEHLRAVAAEALPGAAIDVRPEPERVCPQAGCLGMTVGMVLARREGGCAAIALVSGPGRASAQLVPWAASVRLDHGSVAFRDPAESEITVTDFARCDGLVEAMGQHDEPVAEAIRAASHAAPAE